MSNNVINQYMKLRADYKQFYVNYIGETKEYKENIVNVVNLHWKMVL